MVDDAQQSVERRLLALEEAQAFSERTVEQLNEEVMSVNQRVNDALRRLRRIEERLLAIMDSEDGPDQENDA